MGFSLGLGALKSTQVRNAIGKRTFRAAVHGFVQEQSGGGLGGIIGAIFSAAGRFLGFLLKGFLDWLGSFFQWSLSAIWNWVVQATQMLWTFDWNQSDDSLDKSLDGAWNAFGGILGDFTGYAFGSLVSMGAVGLGAYIFAWDEPLAIHVLEAMGEDALHQLTARASMVMQALVPMVTRFIFVWCYKNTRDMLGLNPTSLYPPDDQVKSEIQAQVAAGAIKAEDADKIIKQRTADNKKARDSLAANTKPWSFAKKYEEWKETIHSEFWKNFVDMAFNSFTQAVMDQGYVAISAAESFAANHKTAHNITSAGSEYSVEVDFEPSTSTTTTTGTTP